jgi:hypothetical protein
MRCDIPDAQAIEIERILRYEPMLHRQLNRAMDQLERLQRRRQGGSCSATCHRPSLDRTVTWLTPCVQSAHQLCA